MNKESIDIFAYADYRLYLKAYYEFYKALDSKFSYRYFSLKSGVAPSLLVDVISGRRTLTLSVMEKYATAMKLSTQEQEYFALMVEFINSKSVITKNQAFSQMARLRGNSKISFIGAEQYEFYNKWYHSIIREIVTLPSFHKDPKSIIAEIFPPITPKEVDDSISFLCDIGLLQQEQDGSFKQTDRIISSEYEIASIALKKFHIQMIDIAQQSIDAIPKEKREISSLTLAISNNCFQQIKERIRHFKEEIMASVIEDQHEADTICQLNFQLYPFLHPQEGVEEHE